MRRSELEARLESVPRPEEARPELEQVRTPAAVAAQLLWLARDDGAIEGRRVLDLGCGTGIFAWGAALLGASKVLGVDVDERALQVAGSLDFRVPAPHFEQADVATWTPEEAWDTIIMNPPFGAQRANRHADRAFYACTGRVPGRTSAWFLARPQSASYLSGMATRLGAQIDQVGQWAYPLERYYAHHEHDAKTIAVAGYRLRW